MIETHSKTVRNFQIPLIGRTREDPSSTAAAVPKAKVPAQLESENMYFVRLFLYISHWELKNGIVLL